MSEQPESPVPSPSAIPNTPEPGARETAAEAPFGEPPDRGLTQPADAPTLAGGYQGYAGHGRFVVPTPGAASDASTVISDPSHHPDNRSLLPGNGLTPPMTPAQQRGVNTSAPQVGPGDDYPAPYAPTTTNPPPSISPAGSGAYTRLARRRRALLTAGAVAALGALLLVGVSYYAFQYAPAQPAARFCRDLIAQRYDDAYQVMSQQLRGGRSEGQFVRDMTTLDLALGSVVSCQGVGLLPLAYTVPSGPASYSVSLVRQPRGDSAHTLRGMIHLSAIGGWQVVAIDTSLLGVNLGALDAAQGYCDALGTQHYAAAYALLGASAQAGLTLDDYTTVEQAHTLISGPVKRCGVTGIGVGNDDTRADVTLTINRAGIGAQSANLALTLVGGVWRLNGVPAAAEGPDVGPYEVGQQFCADLAAGKYDAAYDLFTPQYQAQNPRAQFVGALQTTQAQGIAISCGTPDFMTYTVNGDAAGYVVPYIETYLGIPLSTNDTLTFARQNGHWLIANSDLQSPLG